MKITRARINRVVAVAAEVSVGLVLLWFLLVMVAPSLPAMFRAASGPLDPNWPLLFRQPPQILVHIAAALVALVVGMVQLLGPKGTGIHRLLGWTWVVAMAVTALSALFIRQINDGAFSLIHLLSAFTLIALPMAVHAARTHDVGRHARDMRSLFAGALILAGVLALLPGRLIWAVLIG
jgi:uncharacterized membrane protein